MKAKTKRRLHKIRKHVLHHTKRHAKHVTRLVRKHTRHLGTRKLVKQSTSNKVVKSFLITVTTLVTAVLAYSIVMNKPVVSLAVHTSEAGGVVIKGQAAPATPKPVSGAGTIGKGSWYALGLPQPDALTCASTTYPRGTFLHVTNLSNGRTVVCRVNDYGPEAWTGRIIDLSRGSFVQLDNLGRGVINVAVRVASGPSGYILPLDAEIFNAVVGYNLCRNSHTAQYCDENRQQ